jgi:hypothetical protein
MYTDYAHEIVKTLEARGQSKDYIIGYLQATLNGVKYIESNNEAMDYLKRALDQAQQSNKDYV